MRTIGLGANNFVKTHAEEELERENAQLKCDLAEAIAENGQLRTEIDAAGDGKTKSVGK